MAETNEYSDMDIWCDATPEGKNWPVCCRHKHDDTLHQSADFYWYTGESEPKMKRFT